VPYIRTAVNAVIRSAVATDYPTHGLPCLRLLMVCVWSDCFLLKRTFIEGAAYDPLLTIKLRY